MTTPPTPAEIEAAVKIIREDAMLAGQNALVERLDRMEKRLERLPVTEMTAEEKAAAYDRLMADKNANPPTPTPPAPEPAKGPVPPAPKPEPTDPPKKADRYWGDALDAR